MDARGRIGSRDGLRGWARRLAPVLLIGSMGAIDGNARAGDVAATAAGNVAERDQGTAARDIDPATGYRIANYRSPVTLPPRGGDRVALADVDRLAAQGALLVDVMPARAGYDPATGQWRIVDRRDDLPGSTWLPNTGQGALEPRLAAYFAASLRELSGGRRDRAIVFYCMADCWMSWNAVKRAAALGYGNVHWFADGTDGWSEAGRPLAPAVPRPVPPLVAAQ